MPHFAKNIKQITISLQLICCSLFSFSQNMDDLQKQLATTKNDSTKVEILLSISDALIIKPKEALAYGYKALYIAEQLNNAYLKANTYFAIAYSYTSNGDFDKTLLFYRKAIALENQYKNDGFFSDVYSEMARIYRQQDILDSCLYFNFKALDLRKKVGNKSSIAISYHNIALVYRKKNDWDNAFINFNKALALFTELKDEKNSCKTLTNIGMFYKNKMQYDSVFYCFNKAKPLAKKLNDEYSLYQINLNTALCFNELEKFNEALVILNNLYKDTRLKVDDDYPWLVYGLGVAYVGLKRYNDGINYLKNATTYIYKKSNLEYQGKVNLSLSEAYQNTHNDALALHYYKTYRTYSDSLYNNKNTQNVNDLFAQYKTKEKEQEIVLLNKENELKDLSIKEKQRTNLLYALGLVLISIVALGIYFLFRNKQKFSNQLEDKNKIISVSLKEKEVLLKEIHHRVKNNLQVISSLLSLQSKSISDEKALMALNEGRNRVKSMALIHQNLYRDDNLMGVDVQEYIEKLIDSLFTSYNIEPHKIILKKDIEALQLDVDTVIPVGLVLNELISNALKYAYQGKENGLLEIALKRQDDYLLLRVKDDGKGIDNDDMNKNSATSMGHKLVQSFLQKLNATMSIEKNNGTNIELIIKNFKLT
jgi:two-component sensor histidine kinase